MTEDRFDRVLLKKAREAVKSKVAEDLADRWSYSPTGYEEEETDNGGSVRQNYVTDFYSLIGSGYATDREERDFRDYRKQWETDAWPEYANENGLDPKDIESAEANRHFDRWMEDGFDPIESYIEIEWGTDGWDEEKSYWIRGSILDCCTIEISVPEDGTEEYIDRFFDEFDLRLRSESRRDENMTYDLDESRRPRGRMLKEGAGMIRNYMKKNPTAMERFRYAVDVLGGDEVSEAFATLLNDMGKLDEVLDMLYKDFDVELSRRG